MTTSDSAHSAPPPPKRQKKMAPSMCCICRDALESDDVAYRCSQCKYGQFCAECLKAWFLQACTIEARMPVKCCDVITASSMTHILTAEEIRRYEVKHDEWATFDKLYCPIPRCSAFISASLYLKHPEVDRSEPVKPSTEKLQVISCPDCDTEVCTTCKGLSHPLDGDKCTQTLEDIDPVLEARFKKWGIKRCPRCKAPVRLMYGCSSVQCRCGYHFCFRCLQAIDECDGRCQEEDEEDEEDDEWVNEDEDDDEVDGDNLDDKPDPPDGIPAEMLDPLLGNSPRDGENHVSNLTSTTLSRDRPRGSFLQEILTGSLPPTLGSASRQASQPGLGITPGEDEPQEQQQQQQQPPKQGQPQDATESKEGEDKIAEQQKEEEEAEDLDAAVGSDLDLGSDPDEPPSWQCRHPLWVRTTLKPALRGLDCAWCKVSLLPRHLQSKKAEMTSWSLDRITEELAGATYWACAHCAVPACLKCGEALELKNQSG